VSAIRAFGVTGICACLLASASAAGPAALPPQPAGVAWPTQAWPESAPTVPDAAALAAAEDALFRAVGRSGLPDTRALLAVQAGRLVRERYAEGFGAESSFRSWSAAKSVLNALLAIRVREGALALDAPPPVPEWQGEGDPRAALTLRQLLTMTSGLDNADGEEAGADSYVARILFGDLSADTAHAAAQVSLAHPPGSVWAYSTATSQILSGVLARSVGGGREGVRGFVERELAGPLGAHSLLLEFDAAGTPLGGAFAWATARDWARLGLLYLRGGVWDGRRVLPEGWVEFSRSIAKASNNGVYGAHFWVNGTPGANQFQPLRPEFDAFEMSGSGGQFVVIVPDRDLVLVRLGEMQTTSWEELSAQLSDVVAAFPRRAPPVTP
jgi:CubicO group peptidase (beta-lactamase class C family)